MEHFLYGAENICKEQHLKRPLLIFRNDGASARVAKTTAIKTWGSGPRGGLEGALAYARHYDLDTVVAMDIGGTTTDVSVVKGGQVKLLPYGEIQGVPTSFSLPTIDSFGVGGSSVVSVAGGAIEIGPESVGAVPGPACFARGGTDATLTDALLVAGILDADKYLGGDLKLDVQRAEQAVSNTVGQALGLTVEAAAAAIIEVFELRVGAHVNDALEVSECDPALTTLIAYGGCGPIIASGIARAAGITRVIIPRLASVFSAFGIGFSHLAHEYQTPVDGDGVDLDAARAAMEVKARRDMYGEGVDPETCRYAFSLWSADGECVVERPLDGGPVAIDDSLNDPRLTLRAVYELPALSIAEDTTKRFTPAVVKASKSLSMHGAETQSVDVVEGAALEPGSEVSGPALIQGDYLTCLVDSGWRLRVSSNGDLLVEGN
jgi:N-methylhydantoinase A/oxoprolinase/acetone carboxylase beta subunit